ncbi:hypothetical protein GGI07_000946 [Coemansia sp. Benny D115]|nr:hypothetical protein GGI07_000946 [Coemansia sp. Benny D115]
MDGRNEMRFVEENMLRTLLDDLEDMGRSSLARWWVFWSVTARNTRLAVAGLLWGTGAEMRAVCCSTFPMVLLTVVGFNSWCWEDFERNRRLIDDAVRCLRLLMGTEADVSGVCGLYIIGGE